MLGELRTHLGLLALVAVTSFGRFTVGAGLFNATVEAIFWFLLRLSTQSRVVSLKLWCSGVPLLVVPRAIQKGAPCKGPSDDGGGLGGSIAESESRLNLTDTTHIRSAGAPVAQLP